MTPDEIAVHLGKIDEKLTNMVDSFTDYRKDVSKLFDRLHDCENDLARQQEKCKQVQENKKTDCPPGSIDLKALTAIVAAVTMGIMTAVGGAAFAIGKLAGWW